MMHLPEGKSVKFLVDVKILIECQINIRRLGWPGLDSGLFIMTDHRIYNIDNQQSPEGTASQYWSYIITCPD